MSFGHLERRMLKLVLNVNYLLLLSFLTAAEFYNLGYIQGIRTKGASTQLTVLVICTAFRSASHGGLKNKTNIQY